MESILGSGYSINEESDLINQYSPLSSTIDEDIEQDDNLFYTEDDNIDEGSSSNALTNHATLSSSFIDDIGLGKINTFQQQEIHCFLYVCQVYLNHHRLI